MAFRVFTMGRFILSLVLLFVLMLFTLHLLGIGCGFLLWHSLEFSINFFVEATKCVNFKVLGALVLEVEISG